MAVISLESTELETVLNVVAARRSDTVLLKILNSLRKKNGAEEDELHMLNFASEPPGSPTVTDAIDNVIADIEA